ncbi:MAG: branched-chain amino acid ABC transporter substrate-binding protein [Candidatus Firestonebacteria bacterium]
MNIFVSLVIAVLFFNLTGCSKKAKVIKIGAVAAITGDQAAIGQDLINGVAMAIDEANAIGGINGVQLELYALDDKADPKEAVNAAHKFAVDDDVLAVIGHLNSGCTIPASAVYHDAQLVMITPSATNPAITGQGFENIFRVCVTDDIQGGNSGEFAVKKLKKTRIAIIHDKSAYGQGLAEEFKKSVTNLGAQVLSFEGITPREMDYTAVLTKIKGTKPELLYFGGMYTEGALLVKQIKGLGIKTIFMGGDGLFVPEFIKLSGASSEGSIMSFLALPYNEVESAKNFVEKFTQKYGEIKTYAPYAYDAAKIVIEAIKRAGKLDRKIVLNEMRNTKDFDGITGKTSFDEKGDNLNKQIYFYQVKNGKFIWLK